MVLDGDAEYTLHFNESDAADGKPARLCRNAAQAVPHVVCGLEQTARRGQQIRRLNRSFPIRFLTMKGGSDGPLFQTFRPFAARSVQQIDRVQPLIAAASEAAPFPSSLSTMPFCHRFRPARQSGAATAGAHPARRSPANSVSARSIGSPRPAAKRSGSKARISSPWFGASVVVPSSVQRLGTGQIADHHAGQQLDHGRDGRSLMRRRRAAWRRPAPPRGRSSGAPSLSSAQPSGSGSPARRCSSISPRAATLVAKSKT